MSMPETRNCPRRKTNSCEPMSERLLPWTMTDTSGLSKQRSGAGGSSRRTSTRPSMGLGRISGAGRCRIRMSFRAARISSLMDRAEDAMRTSGSGCLSSVTKRRRGEKTPPRAPAGRRHEQASAPEERPPVSPEVPSPSGNRTPGDRTGGRDGGTADDLRSGWRGACPQVRPYRPGITINKRE